MNNICSICNKKFDDKYFDKEQNKCILHCEKDDWYEITPIEKDWLKSKEQIKLFWQKVRIVIENSSKDDDYQKGDNLDFSNTIFPKFEEQNFQEEEIDENESVIVNWEHNFCNQNISQNDSSSCILDARLDFYNSTFLDDVDFDYYEFKEFISFNNVKFEGKCYFKNTVFNNVFFNNVNFSKEVLFDNAKLNLGLYKTKDFLNSVFHDKVKFYETTFGKESSRKDFDIDFRATEFNKIQIVSCTFHHGLRFYKNVKVKYIDLQNMNLKNLYIASDTEEIHIRGNKKEINKLTIKHNNLKRLIIHNCTVKDDFLLNDKIWKKDEVFKLEQLNFSESTFQSKVKIQFYEITGTANFYNTKFKDLADFYRTKFNEVVFERTDFEKISVFSEVEFNKDVNFKYTKFLGKSIFRDTVIKGKLNLRDTIFDDDANFLDVTSEKRQKDKNGEFYGEPKVIQVANRETSKNIKSFYEYSNNIIEANKFYALEMQEKEKDLNTTILKGKNIIDWIIFKFHSLSSNHSQAPVLPVLWILNIAFIYSMFLSTLCIDKMFANIEISIVLLNMGIYMLIKNDIFLKVILIINVFIASFLSYITFATIADKINPFSIMTSKEPITFGLLIFKITIAYLIYQFIVSVRQNTRRK